MKKLLLHLTALVEKIELPLPIKKNMYEKNLFFPLSVVFTFKS